ncbi:MAG: YbjQ family protein [Dehalococcoidia bacterium]
MLIATTDEIPGARSTRVVGLVQGHSVRARGAVRDITASIRNVFGGNIPEYAELMQQARASAMAEMVRSAEDQGANAIVATRFGTADVMSSAVEILVYGTAVVTE